jgi:hypothetical protein
MKRAFVFIDSPCSSMGLLLASCSKKVTASPQPVPPAIVPAPVNETAIAFPGAEGFGMNATAAGEEP